MHRLRQLLTVPATESNLALALSFSAVVMGLMLLAIVWQSSVIEHQRDVIRLLWQSLSGGRMG